MPYITKQEVKEKREAIKKALPEFKFSVTCKDYSCINVAILSGPVDLLHGSKGYTSVNHFHYKRQYENSPEILEVLEKVVSIANGDNYIASEDGDYGSIPSFYFNLSIGKWDKPYQVKA